MSGERAGGGESKLDSSLRIAMIGTRGVPAAYGGFETAVEEIGRRLVHRGHEVTVYCRSQGRRTPLPRQHLGMDLVHLPAIRNKSTETLSHTALSVTHAILQRRPDAAYVFNAANAPFVPWLRLRQIPTAVHVDGLEWQRGKWGPAGKRYYRWAEEFCVRQADALIADAQGIVDYYASEFAVPTELITYGSRILRNAPSDRLAELGLRPGQYHLVVARFEPENHVDVILEGYLRSTASFPLVVVGSAPYAAAYTNRIAERAASDPRIRVLGALWDQVQLDQLYAHAVTYLHGHSVGGTNPSLLRAMGAGTAVIAWNVVFNREVLGNGGVFFDSASSLAPLIEDAELAPHHTSELGSALQCRAEQRHDWERVTDGYEALALRLREGYSTRGTSTGRIRDARSMESKRSGPEQHTDTVPAKPIPS
jgi:glycosyltransferase involved in cell wall biosynthesis